MTAAVCGTCELEMKPVKTGALVEEMAGMEPYKLWFGDAFQCHGCGATVVTRFSVNSASEHWQPDYQKRASERFCRAYQRTEEAYKARHEVAR